MSQNALLGRRGIWQSPVSRKRENGQVRMDDRQAVTESKAAVLQAMQRYALEQSVEESVNVNPESENAGRQTLRGMWKRESQGKQVLRQLRRCAAERHRKAAEGARRSEVRPRNRPATITTIIIITIIISRNAGG